MEIFKGLGHGNEDAMKALQSLSFKFNFIKTSFSLLTGVFVKLQYQ